MTATAPQTLLEKATARKLRVGTTPGGINEEMLELVVAYANHKITCGQAAAALGCKTGNAITRMSTFMMSAVRNGHARFEIT